MKPTETLKNEHQAILLMLEVVEGVSRRLAAGEDVPEPRDFVPWFRRQPFRGPRWVHVYKFV